MIHVVTYFETKPSAADEGTVLLKAYRATTLAESGVSTVDVFQELHRKNRFVVLETWSTDVGFQSHETAADTGQFRTRLAAIQAAPLDQRIHQSFAIGNAKAAAPVALNVVTHVDVPPPRREETEALLKVLAEDSRKDAGNLRYDIFQQNTPRTNHFTVVGVWSNEDHFSSYQIAAHTQRFREALGPMLGAPYDERLYVSK